ncbi:MAG: glycoside hydrolase family 3, partial [Bacteroidota bacterium]
MKQLFILFSLFIHISVVFSQGKDREKHWADSVFKTLSKEEKIAQLMIVRAHSNLGQKHVDEV